MRKLLLAAGVLALVCVGADPSTSQTREFQSLIISTTADAIIDSSLTSSVMDDKRLYINGIYYWYDNAANTNPITFEIVSGKAAMATQGARRNLRFSEAMTSGGIKGSTIIPNLTTQADSTIYVSLSATGSDSLLLIINYKFVGE